MNRGGKESTPQSQQTANFEPRSEQERIWNQTIAKRLKVFLENHGSSLNTAFTLIDLKLAKKDPDYSFKIFPLQKQEGQLPENVSLPLYALALDYQARRFRNNDGNIYHGEIIHLFNERGQGITRVFIKKDSTKIYTPDVAIGYPPLSIPHKNINRPFFYTFKTEDRAKIEALITRAESDGWNKPQVLKPHTVFISIPTKT